MFSVGRFSLLAIRINNRRGETLLFSNPSLQADNVYSLEPVESFLYKRQWTCQRTAICQQDSQTACKIKKKIKRKKIEIPCLVLTLKILLLHFVIFCLYFISSQRLFFLISSVSFIWSFKTKSQNPPPLAHTHILSYSLYFISRFQEGYK